MSEIPRQSFAQALADRAQAAFGAGRRAEIQAAVFFTYTFHRQNFEEDLLPALYGLPAGGERSARLHLLQLSHGETTRPVVFHDAHLPIDGTVSGKPVDPTALGASSALRLDVVPVRWGGASNTCMHAKHVLLLLKPGGTDNSAERALLVATTSANLTLAGWRRNIELCDIEVLRHDQSSGMTTGLRQLIADAWAWAAAAGQSSAGASLPGLRQIEGFVAKLNDAPDAFPRLWTGRNSLDEAIVAGAAALKLGTIRQITAGSPYLSEDAVALGRLVAALKPDALKLLRPTDALGAVMSTPEWEKNVEQAAPNTRVTHHKLVGQAEDDGKQPRTTHLKWIAVEGEAGALLALGSPNLSTAAFGPSADGSRALHNYETAVLRKISTGLQWLEPAPLARLTAVAPSPDLSEDPNGPKPPQDVALVITYDWTRPPQARARLLVLTVGDAPPADAHLRLIGSEATADSAPLGLQPDTQQLGEAASALVGRALEHHAYIELVEPAHPGGNALVQIVELNQELAPPRRVFRTSIDQLLRTLIAFGLGDHAAARRLADAADQRAAERDEGVEAPDGGRPAIALDRPIAMIQATMMIEKRARAAAKNNDLAGVARALFDQSGISLRKLVDLHRPPPPTEAVDTEAVPEKIDLVDVLVCWLCARTLIDALWADAELKLHAEPALQQAHTDLDRRLADLDRWDKLDDTHRGELRDWMHKNWRETSTKPAASPEVDAICTAGAPAT
jgi:hypothetical protein